MNSYLTFSPQVSEVDSSVFDFEHTHFCKWGVNKKNQ